MIFSVFYTLILVYFFLNIKSLSEEDPSSVQRLYRRSQLLSCGIPSDMIPVAEAAGFGLLVIWSTLDSGIDVGPMFINFGFFQALRPYLWVLKN